MLKCLECGATFENAIEGREEEKDSCPNCGSWYIYNTEPCILCGEPTVYNFPRLCDSCMEQFKDAVKGFVGLYATTMKLKEDDVIELMQGILEEM